MTFSTHGCHLPSGHTGVHQCLDEEFEGGQAHFEMRELFNGKAEVRYKLYYTDDDPGTWDEWTSVPRLEKR